MRAVASPQHAVYSAVLSLSPSFIFLPLARVVCIRSELDEALPVSSVFWHCLFWGCTSNHTILPDSFGSASFKAMLSDLGLLELVSMARQDSGKLSRFAEIYPAAKKMASEIETFAVSSDTALSTSRYRFACTCTCTCTCVAVLRGHPHGARR